MTYLRTRARVGRSSNRWAWGPWFVKVNYLNPDGGLYASTVVDGFETWGEAMDYANRVTTLTPSRLAWLSSVMTS